MFQSVPDSWAIGQIFPIMPIHRLDEKPQRHAILHDLTCDSDGRIDAYVTRQGAATTLPTHGPRDKEPYLLGVFLSGAYQEVLGDIHNLFGDTTSINVHVRENGKLSLQRRHRGDRVCDLLRQVDMDTQNVQDMFQRRTAALPLPERKQYLDELLSGLAGYTYLEE